MNFHAVNLVNHAVQVVERDLGPLALSLHVIVHVLNNTSMMPTFFHTWAMTKSADVLSPMGQLPAEFWPMPIDVIDLYAEYM